MELLYHVTIQRKATGGSLDTMIGQKEIFTILASIPAYLKLKKQQHKAGYNTLLLKEMIVTR